jgi:transposase
VRDLTRSRMALLQERSRLVNRIHTVLEDANLKLASVVTAIMGMTGHAILTALVAGETDPERLAHLAGGNLVKKQEQLSTMPSLSELMPSRGFLDAAARCSLANWDGT